MERGHGAVIGESGRGRVTEEEEKEESRGDERGEAQRERDCRCGPTVVTSVHLTRRT